MKDLERRFYPAEFRLAQDAREIIGTAVRYNSRSVDLGGFVEIVSPGALTRTLADAGRSIRLLFNHDSGYVLGGTANSTLTLTDTDTGLDFRNDPPETTWANDLLVSLRRGDISQCSFGFSVLKDAWQQVDGVMVRTLLDIDLCEISIVAFPAYPDTSVSVRSLESYRSAVDALRASSDQQTPADVAAVQQKLGLMLRHLELADQQ